MFPLGAAIALVGVGHWLAHSLGLIDEYRSIFHAITQIQSFMMCFAVGFLFTALPRRTGTHPVATWQLAIAVVAPLGTMLSAWLEHWVISQVFWLALILVLLGFTARRFLSREAKRRAPTAFVWIPASLLIGLAGSILAGMRGMLGEQGAFIHDIGRGLLLQGMFVGLIVGVGGMVLPLLTRKDAPPDGTSSPLDWLIRSTHILAALVLAASFFLEHMVSVRAGFAARAAIVLIELVFFVELWRPPAVPGWHRGLVWLSGWMVALGYVFGAAFPRLATAGLHITFIGGFALMAFSVSAHVTLAHGGWEKQVYGRTWQSVVIGVALLTAVVARILVDADPSRFFLWLGVAATAFLVAIAAWGALVLPRLRPALDR